MFRLRVGERSLQSDENRYPGTFVLGAKSTNELFLLDEPLESGARVFVSTDDGTRGFKGFVTQLARSILESERFDALSEHHLNNT
jgi:NAD(P)H-flavin reductase